MIIDRYLIREICKPLLVIWTILVVIFGSYTSTEYLSEAANAMLVGRAVAGLVFFKLVIGLEFLVPISLYLSVVISLGRLYADAEMTALHACGVSVGRVLKAVLLVSLFLAAVTAVLSLYLRPWAYERFYELRDRAQREFDLTRMEDGNFLEIRREHSVIFADEIDHEQGRAKRVFIQKEKGDALQVILAREAYQRMDQRNGRRVLLFLDGNLYDFSREGKGDSVSTFQRSTWSLPREEMPPVRYKRRAASTEWLAGSSDPRDIAEFQWRLSVPLTTMLLAILAVPLSRTAPRQGKYANVAAAVIVYVLYYNLCAVAKSWIEQGVVGFVPGLWWVQLSLAAFVFFLLWKHHVIFGWRGRLRVN